MIRSVWLAVIIALLAQTHCLYAASDRDDLWQRIRDGLRLTSIEREEVRAQIDWVRKRKMMSLAVQRRARPFLYYIVEQVERRGLPMELALLPAVESGFRPFAESSEGAVGLWQFTAATGIEHGLEQGWWYDGRRDLLASTHAALDYLTFLARRFDGDWMLALAAYNAGIGRVQAARKVNLSEGGQGDFWSLDLPLETRQYVPRVVALGRLVAQPRQHGVSLIEMRDRHYFTPLVVDYDLTLQELSRVAELDQGTLLRLNAGLNPLYSLIEKDKRVLIPVAAADRVRKRLAAQEDGKALARRLIDEARGRQLLGLLRRAHARSVEGSADSSTFSSLWIKGRLDYHARQAQRRDAEGRKRVHVVRAGESLEKIAIAYRVAPESISEWNDLDPGADVRPGQTLIIWVMG